MSTACPSGDTHTHIQTLLPSLSKHRSRWWCVSSLENLAKSFLAQKKYPGDKAGDALRMRNDLFPFHFLPAFLSGADRGCCNGWYVIRAHAGWIKFLMAPRAVVLAVKKKKLLQQCGTVGGGVWRWRWGVGVTAKHIPVLLSKNC